MTALLGVRFLEIELTGSTFIVFNHWMSPGRGFRDFAWDTTKPRRDDLFLSQLGTSGTSTLGSACSPHFVSIYSGRWKTSEAQNTDSRPLIAGSPSTNYQS